MLTPHQQARVRLYLGYPDPSRGGYSRLEGAMHSVSAGGEAQIVRLLDDLDAIEAQLRTSWSRQKVSSAEGVVLAGHDEIQALRMEGRRLVRSISTILGVAVGDTPFGGSGGGSGMAGRG